MLRKHPTILLVALCALSPVAANAFWPFDSEQELFAQDCEVVLKDRLVSPSSYARIELSEITRGEGDLNDFLELTTPERIKKRAALVASDPEYATMAERQKKIYSMGKLERLSIFIIYDASNKMGVALRDTVECSDYIDRGSEWSDHDYHKPRINGLSALSWSIDQISN